MNADIRHYLATVNAINRFAEPEGWAIFNADAPGQGEIQRDDEQNVFPGDAAAVAHVERLAAAGSVLHRMALEMTADSRPRSA